MAQRTKNILLVVGFVVVLYICYTVSIRRTLDLGSQVKQWGDSIETFSLYHKRTLNIKAKEAYLDSILSANNLEKGSVQNNVLDFLNHSAEKKAITIIDFNKPHSFTEDGLVRNSYSFSLRGDFRAIQDIIYYFEQQTALGTISHVNFEKKKNYRNNKEFLECFVVIENLVAD